MSNESLREFVYSNPVIEFVTVANEYCKFLEQVTELTKDEFIQRALKILTLLYLKGSLLPDTRKILDEPIEKFVTEYDWMYIRNGVQNILGEDDLYIDNYDLEMNELPEPATYSVSEHMADIYQDIKDFIEIFKLDNETLSNDAIFECFTQFKFYWGPRLLHTTRILHLLAYLKPSQIKSSTPYFTRNTNEWFITKAQNDYQKRKDK